MLEAWRIADAFSGKNTNSGINYQYLYSIPIVYELPILIIITELYKPPNLIKHIVFMVMLSKKQQTHYKTHGFHMFLNKNASETV